MGFQHEDITNICDRSEITDHAGKTDLLAPVVINSKAERMLNRSSNDLSRNTLGPVTIRQEPVNHIQIETPTAGTDQKLAAPVLRHHFGIDSAAGRHAHILPLRPRQSRYPSKAVRKNEASCQPSMYLYGVSPMV